MPATPALSPRAQPLRRYLQRLIGLCLLPLAAVILLLAADEVRRSHVHRSQEVQALATRLATEVDADLTRRIQGLTALSRVPRDLDTPADLRDLYAHALAYQESFGTPVALGDRQRQLLFSTRVPLGTALPSMPDPPGPRSALRLAQQTGEVMVGDPMTSPVTGTPLVPIVAVAHNRSTPVPVSERSPASASGVWIASIDLAHYDRMLQALAAPDGWRVALLDSTGRPITPRPAASAGGASATATWKWDEAPSERHVVRPVRNAPWSVVVKVPAWRYYLPHLEVGALTLVCLTLTLGLSGWVAGRASRQLGNEVARLSDPPGEDHRHWPALNILEIEAAHHELQTLAQARDRAESERRRAQARHLHAMQSALRSFTRSETRLRAIFDGSSEGVMLVNEDLHVVTCNAAMAEMVGGSVRQMKGERLLQFVPVPQYAAHAATFQELRRLTEEHGRATRRSVVTMLRRDGSAFKAESCITCVRVAQEWLYVVLLHDVTEREQQAQRLQRTHEQLAEAHRELHRLNAAQRTVEERERQRIARDLHDDLQQQLGVIQMKLELIAAQTRDIHPSTAQLATQGRDATRQAIDAIRRIVNDLRPRALDELGLIAALQQLTDQTADTSGLQIELELIGGDEALNAWPEAACNCIYRLVQECLNNVRKHARASFVHILLDASDANELVLQVSDDGRGIRDEDLRKADSFGLRSMTERLAPLHGRVRVQRGHGGDATRGTTVHVAIPRSAAQNAQNGQAALPEVSLSLDTPTGSG